MGYYSIVVWNKNKVSPTQNTPTLQAMDDSGETRLVMTYTSMSLNCSISY